MKWIDANERLPDDNNYADLCLKIHGSNEIGFYNKNTKSFVTYSHKKRYDIDIVQWLDESQSDDSEPLIAELIRLYNKHGEESTRLVLEAYKKEKEKI